MFEYSILLIRWILLDEVEQLHLQRVDLCFLVVQGKLDLLNLFFDKTELLLREICVFGTKLIQIELLLLSSGGLHFSSFFVDGHVEDLVEVGNPLEHSRFDDVNHDGILQFDGEAVSVDLLFATSLLVFSEDGGISRDDVIKSNWVILVHQLELNIFDLFGELWTALLDL